MNSKEINVVIVGLGSIGRAIATSVVGHGGLRLVAAVDSAPEFVGKRLSEVIEANVAQDLTVAPDVSSVLRGSQPGVVVLATSSQMKAVVPQVQEALAASWNVVSTCEELSNPWMVDEVSARSLNDLALQMNASVLGTGINPGFLMDSLPLLLTGLCREVSRIKVLRIVDTNHRREALQRKVGVGMSQEMFAQMAESGSIGHVGLEASAASIANRLGWSPFSYEQRLEPVIASAETATGLGLVKIGDVIGQDQVAKVNYAGEVVIELRLAMWAGAAMIDSIEIDGTPPIKQEIPGGVNGDLGTEAIIVNSIRPVFEAAPGLLTMPQLLPLAAEMN